MWVTEGEADAGYTWGQNWQQRIDETLNEVTLLLVIITPGLFRSPACRAEVRRFEERERKLGRQDLIRPVYYISAREMDDPALRESDDMARLLASRQHVDWRELRFEPFTSPVVRKAIAQLAARMRDVFWQPSSAAPAGQGRTRPLAKPRADIRPTGAPEPAITRTEPPTHVVDAYQRGDFVTVGAAIKAAKPGDRILVRPGLYEEGLIVDKPLEILGDGQFSEIEIRARGASPVQFVATIGRIANLTLRQAGGTVARASVDIRQGRLDLEGCDISSQSASCVIIYDGADPRLRRNKIHDSKGNGVYVLDNGLGTLEDNEVTSNTNSGVVIDTSGNPTMRRNEIHRNGDAGVWITNGGQGILEKNDLTDNTNESLVIDQDCRDNVILRDNKK